MNILQDLLISLRGSKTIIVVTHQFNDIKKIFDNIYEIDSTKLLSKLDKKLN